VMTVFMHENLGLILHCNASLLLTIHRTLVYRVWVSVGPTAVDRGMEGVVVDLLECEARNLLDYGTLEMQQRRGKGRRTGWIHENTIALEVNVSAVDSK
jgi:uncharacterized protein (UPF0548 family)